MRKKLIPYLITAFWCVASLDGVANARADTGSLNRNKEILAVQGWKDQKTQVYVESGICFGTTNRKLDGFSPCTPHDNHGVQVSVDQEALRICERDDCRLIEVFNHEKAVYLKNLLVNDAQRFVQLRIYQYCKNEICKDFGNEVKIKFVDADEFEDVNDYLSNVAPEWFERSHLTLGAD